MPFALARAARDAGIRIAAVGHVGETDPALEAEVDSMEWVRLGQLRRISRTLRAAGAGSAVLVGGLKKASYFDGARPDLSALKLLATLPRRGDDRLLRAIADWFGSQGLEIVAPGELLRGCFAPVGPIAGPAATRRELEDAAEGLRVARLLGTADVGQTVVVREGAIVAVEAMEGTDACIRRAGLLAPGVVVVKAQKPGQDLRFDLPAIGPCTIAVLAEARGRLLAVEAGSTVLLDAGELRAEAARLGISVVGLAGGEG